MNNNYPSESLQDKLSKLVEQERTRYEEESSVKIFSSISYTSATRAVVTYRWDGGDTFAVYELTTNNNFQSWSCSKDWND